MLSTGAIYASTPEARTALLQNGLSEIVNVIKPTDKDGWAIVKTDSERLLKVWYSNEEGTSYAKEVVDQILGILTEFSSAPAPAPAKMPPQGERLSAAPVAMVISEKILHVEEAEEAEAEEAEAEAEAEEAEAEAEAEEAEAEAEAEAEEAEAEAEEAEAEAEAEAEEAVEVEQIFIRGRSYWLDTNTQKLYANDENEEIGEEVGAMVNGKPVFLSP
jgi:glucan-binding YG repeat protein